MLLNVKVPVDQHKTREDEGSQRAEEFYLTKILLIQVIVDD